MPGVAWLFYSMLVLLLLALLGAALFFWQHTPARNKIPRAQRRRVVALQQMEALAKRLRQQECTGVDQSLTSVLPSPQEPSLDPKPNLELPLETLVQKLQDEELSVESVLCSYLEEALKVHQEVNCLTDFLGECEEQLQALKKLRKTERGLLYGVPVSLKDPYDCKGHDSTCGLTQFLGKPAAKDGVIVQVLKAQGAIPFVKTNIPQTLYSFDCSNPIYGQTLNPLNLKKTPGGSSGGEGALLAKGGSILGMGTDTAGSIRVPASFCGICGFRTTGYRLSLSGVSSAVKGKISVTTVAGPMARDVESLALCLRALLSEDMHRLDPTVPFMPFREEVYSSNQRLRIGFCETDGFTQPSPSMARAVRLTSRLLQDAGHQVIPFSIPHIKYAVKHLFEGGLFADGGATLLEKLEGDIVDPCIKGMVNWLCLPDLLKCFLAWILKYTEYQQKFIAKWRSLDLDVLLMPAMDPASHICYSEIGTDIVSYTGLYNILNFPAGVVPVTTVTPQDEEELAFYTGYYRDSTQNSAPGTLQCFPASSFLQPLTVGYSWVMVSFFSGEQPSAASPKEFSSFTGFFKFQGRGWKIRSLQGDLERLPSSGPIPAGRTFMPVRSLLKARQSEANNVQSTENGEPQSPSGAADLSNTGDDHAIHTIGLVVLVTNITDEFRAPASPAQGRGCGVEGACRAGASPGPARRPAAGPAPSQAPPRRRRFEVPIRQIESINYEGNNLAAPRGAAAERSRGIRPQIALSLPK
ncbi:vitamin D3 hydroxylase-associated protein-like [Felis catus]|uniref:vitamin D3 hydroxylase-associated protein-like n=1 Tax=Felis catus TaxID=9685 RepID=UPI001D1A0FBC|nr:vitamin D3 hydroxylase-associated protein-like [Felis catus]